MATDLWGTIGWWPRSPFMARPLRLWLMLTVTLLVMLFAGAFSVWWVVPHWTVGSWSARLQFILRSDTSRSRWVRTYADALGSHMDQGFSSWLAEEFQHLPFNDDRRTAAIRFFALRADRNRVIRVFLKQDTHLMPEIVAVQRRLPVDERLAGC
jgi:hypothetical protein